MSTSRSAAASLPRAFRVLLSLVPLLTSVGPIQAFAQGSAWEPFVSFPPSTTGRTRAVAMVYQNTLFVLGGEPLRCPDEAPCAEPERGAADYLPLGGTDWLAGAPFDDGLNRLGGGIDGLGRPVAFGGARFDDGQGNDRTFFYDIVLADQTEPSLARRNFLHTNFAYAGDDQGRLYAIGGGPCAAASAANPNASDVERYDAQSDTWTVLAPMPEGRACSAAVFDGQGRILVFGGFDPLATERRREVLAYDIAGDSWSVLGELPLPPEGSNAFSDQRAALGANGKVYLLGGINGPVAGGTTRADVYTYEPVAGAFGVAPTLSTPRHGAAVTVDDEGWLYAIGGSNDYGGLDTSERLDTSPAGAECIIGADCSDGMACNGAEFCVDGACVAGLPVECQVGEICISGGQCRVQRFDIIDLSALLGDAGGTATAVNQGGTVVGEYVDGIDWRAFAWDGEVIRDVGPGRALAIADDGWIVGEDGTAFAIDPAGNRFDLGTLGGAGSSALAVASGGWVAGQSDTAGSSDHAFLVRGIGAAMEDLGTLGDYSLAHAIDPLGRVVGESLVVNFDPHAEPFVFDPTLPEPAMEPLTGTYAAGSARAVNDAGHVTGWVSSHVDNWGHAFIHDGVTLIDLGAITGKAYSIGTAINGFDQVVGYAFGEWVDTECCGLQWKNNIHRAYLHDGTGGVNLNDELPEDSGWVLTVATGINDAGIITGTGTRDGVGRAFVLLPVTGAEADTDGDGIGDETDNCPVDPNPGQGDADADTFGNACDNCTVVANADQRDSNGDGYGNICDPDLDDSGRVDRDDFLLLRGLLGSDDADADLDGNGRVDAADLAIMRSMFRRPPGPSSEAP